MTLDFVQFLQMNFKFEPAQSSARYEQLNKRASSPKI